MIERRRAARYNFEAVAEVVDLGSGRKLVCIPRDLSLSGCFLATMTPMPQGAEVFVNLTSSAARFGAKGVVTANVSSEGMGVEFKQMASADEAVLQEWLKLAAVTNRRGTRPLAISAARKPYTSPRLETYGDLRTIANTVGLNGARDNMVLPATRTAV